MLAAAQAEVFRRIWITPFRWTRRWPYPKACVKSCETLVIALVLVIIVVFIFLQGWRASLIPFVAVPVSLIGTFAFFPIFGFSINTLSLFGLVLAIGLVVDDAIVVVEAPNVISKKAWNQRTPRSRRWMKWPGPVVALALDPGGGFRPDNFHRAASRAALSAIRADDCDFGYVCPRSTRCP